MDTACIRRLPRFGRGHPLPSVPRKLFEKRQSQEEEPGLYFKFRAWFCAEKGHKTDQSSKRE